MRRRKRCLEGVRLPSVTSSFDQENVVWPKPMSEACAAEASGAGVPETCASKESRSSVYTEVSAKLIVMWARREVSKEPS
jgi:hypothetical protein